MRKFAIIALAMFLGNNPDLHAQQSLPRFTGEREAAALFFVKKHCQELVPILDELRKNNASQYELQVREIFLVTEMLAEIEDERRHDLELKIWKTENRAFLLVAKLGLAKDDERKSLETLLQEVTRELVELDVQSLEMKAEHLEKDLAETKEDLGRLKENFEKSIKERFESLLDKSKRRKKM